MPRPKKAPAKKPAPKKGRPAGRKTARRDRVDVLPSRCRKCGSTERFPYTNPRTIEHAGTAPDGQPYDRIILRNTRCTGCGQARIDRFYELRGKPRALPERPAA